jgi:two-component system, OmpR family, sensor kinase
MTTEATTDATTEATTESTALPAPPPTPPADAEVLRPRHRRSLRTRILASYVVLLTLATAASVLVAREVLISQLDGRIADELVQEAEELRALAGGADPETARPFAGDVQRIFEVHLSRNVPSRNEALLTFVDGEPFKRSRTVVDYRLDRDPALVERWGSVTTTDRGSVETPEGRVEYLAVPLAAGDEVRGVFVSVIFRDRAVAMLNAPLAAVAGVGIAVLLVGSALAWRLAEGVLRPVRRVTRTARTIEDTDLRRRIEVEGDDEVADLARTFNAMLDRLERSFSRQRRFLDDAGHELRTPITIARGHLELLDDDPVEREQTVALVLDELGRMGRIVNDLLLLAKTEEPNFLETAPFEVGALTDELAAKVAALAPREWVVESRAEGGVTADRQRLTQAVVQLAQNAVQHTDDGDEIALGSFLADGELRLWVRDTGPGITPEEQEKVFDRFVRGRDARQRDGAGLGLSIVRAITEAHRGRVELRSTPGSGALFTLVLPAAPGEEPGGTTA